MTTSQANSRTNSLQNWANSIFWEFSHCPDRNKEIKFHQTLFLGEDIEIVVHIYDKIVVF